MKQDPGSDQNQAYWDPGVIAITAIEVLAGALLVYLRLQNLRRTLHPIELLIITCEVVYWMSGPVRNFVYFKKRRRQEMKLKQILKESEFPTVDVYIPCYNEPVKVRGGLSFS